MNREEFYSSTRWKKLRESVLRRDRYQSVLSSRYSPIAKPAQVVHHIFPREWWPEYQWSPWNLISITLKEHQELHGDNGELTRKGVDLLKRTAQKQCIDADEQLALHPDAVAHHSGADRRRDLPRYGTKHGRI